MILVSLPRSLDHDKKRYWGMIFKPQNATSTKSECKLSHASLSPTLGVTKSKAKRNFLERKILGRSDFIVINIVKSSKQFFRGTSYWKFLGKTWWITNKYGWLVYTMMRIPELKDHWNLFIVN